MGEAFIRGLGHYDVVPLGFAAAVGGLATLAALGFLDRGRVANESRADLWVVLAALSMGFGIWAMHFLALLAFVPGTETAFAIMPIVASLLVAIVMSRIGFGLAQGAAEGQKAALGGALLGAGIALAQLGGTLALNVAGHLIWDPVPVVISMVFGAALCSWALSATLRKTPLARVAGASLLGLAPFAIHEIGMSALDIVPDPRIAIPPSLIAADHLAAAVATVTLVLIAASVCSTVVDLRVRRRRQREAELRALADAAVEGLMVCDADRIVSVNNALMKLAGLSSAELTGCRLADVLPDADPRTRLLEVRDASVETEWLRRDGTRIPVEVFAHAIDFAGRPHLAYAVRDLRDRQEAERRIVFLAEFDALTGLANRSSFNARLASEIETAGRAGHALAVLSLDLDRFKEVNDLFGHLAGDRILQIAAGRLTAALTPEMALARLGDDEFALCVPLMSDAAVAGEVAETVIASLRMQTPEGSAVSTIDCSIGIALYPNDAADPETLLNHADTALNRAKAEGGGTHRYFEAAMGAQVRERRQIEHDLRLSVPREELKIVYQPQVVVASEEIIGFEALLRWHRPDRGEVSPAYFIPIAEESGSIMQIGEWVMNKVCQQAATWPVPLRIGVNVSAIQLHSLGFPTMVQTILQKTGIDPDRLELEITETALVRDFERALASLRQLKHIGVRISMDDFGTGYSSLSTLRAFPFDRIKIDRSFVSSIDRNAQSAAIIRAVLGLGRGLDLPILAEGVETEAEMQFLHRESCQEAQGFLIGRPAPIETFRDLTHFGARSEPAAAA